MDGESEGLLEIRSKLTSRCWVMKCFRQAVINRDQSLVTEQPGLVEL